MGRGVDLLCADAMLLDLLNCGSPLPHDDFSESFSAACVDDLVQSDPWKDLTLYKPDLVEDLKPVDAKGGPHVASGAGLQLHHQVDGQSWSICVAI